jgi:hypothetical protein
LADRLAGLDVEDLAVGREDAAAAGEEDRLEAPDDVGVPLDVPDPGVGHE